MDTRTHSPRTTLINAYRRCEYLHRNRGWQLGALKRNHKLHSYVRSDGLYLRLYPAEIHKERKRHSVCKWLTLINANQTIKCPIETQANFLKTIKNAVTPATRAAGIPKASGIP